MTDRQSITVIIPTWNRAELLAGCLGSLAAQTVPCRILVVDNGSQDGTDQMVRDRFPQVEYLPLGYNFGFAKAVNAGIRSARTPYLALLNNDTEADTGWVEAGLEALERDTDFWFFASKMIRYHDRRRLDGAGDCYSRSGMPYKRGAGRPVGEYAKDGPVMGASAGAAFYRRELFERVGLFDEGFHMYLEDVDLSLRAQIDHRGCLYLARAQVYHMEAASDPDRSRGARTVAGRQGPVVYSRSRVFWITRNRWLLMVKYQPFRHLPWLVRGWARSCLFHLIKAGFTADFLRGIRAGIRHAPAALQSRRILLRQRPHSIGELWNRWKEC